MSDATAVATAYIDAVGAGRWDEVAGMLHPDATFEIAGGGRHEGAAAFLAAFDTLKPIIERNDIRSVIADGDRVCVLYDFVTRTPVGAVVSAEWLDVDDDGRITSSYLLFDKGRWGEVMQRIARPAAPAPP